MHPIVKPAFAPRPTRRGFLAGTGGLILGLHLAPQARAESSAPTAPTPGAFVPNAFIRVAPDDTVTVLVKHIEIGQGANTGLPLLVAEEMDADWSQMRAEQAPSNPQLYANAAFGIQGTGGSTGLSNSYMTMRRAGAAARAMLVSAAADLWGVPAAEITVSKGVVAHGPTGNEASFGALAEAAAKGPVPEDVALKDPADFTLIGAEGITRLDARSKSTGQAEFTIDVYRDGMQVVAMVHPPKFGATVASVDDSEALAIPGVRAVRQLPSGVAIYADDTFAAFRGRDAVVVEWDESAAETRGTDEIVETFTAAARTASLVAEEAGDADAALAGAERVIEAEYVFPYLAHAAMEPLDGVIEWDGSAAEIWSGMQIPTTSHATLAGVMGLGQEAVTINTMYTGGSFGRRATPDNHFAAELANVAMAGGPGAYKLLWTRENDMQGGYYRPLTVHRLRAGLDGAGNITGWVNQLANQSIMRGSPFEAMMQGGLDPTSYEGANDLPYELPNRRLAWAEMRSPVPVLWWRAVGHTHTAYAVETFLDEVLETGGRDPVQGRLDMMRADRPRDRAVLERVAEMAGWSGPGTGDRRYGVAMARSFGSYVAQVAEVEDRDGAPHVTRVWCAVDCGLAVTPDVVRAQMEGGIGYGLSSILGEAVTLEPGGRVAQVNFDGYTPLRLPEMPRIEVSILPSAEPPSGVGEPGLPPIGPAVANAWRALSGQAVRRLPMRPA
ncbi:xanthine dehydrogenase family protein molybdopterin-binding subunit [Jannaschia seohaensis]|uniref:Isoquinoline 1-oxidoreductase beta subunit n=1 Tax=Jannaschia seohaensis TaxID=475081 RepID=A0A2Y9A2L8_9RHOB|nr:xanthine dehydrogenase family protein molybdopterin-binding subunit [Jannaschia seohaensis]PWJ21838.1 isoquinoline 1-oxidoreductase beta subunit [Jannaschia seohaensis]SSA38116.1 isoquinoline 1-oxidoreductase, beta subunit [Jannaschia seohaensis]